MSEERRLTAEEAEVELGPWKPVLVVLEHSWRVGISEFRVRVLPDEWQGIGNFFERREVVDGSPGGWYRYDGVEIAREMVRLGGSENSEVGFRLPFWAKA